MARKIATLKKKRLKSKPLCYIDAKGHLRHRKASRKKGKGSIYVRNAVAKKYLTARKNGKNLYVRGKVGKPLTVWQGKGIGKKRKRRKVARRKKKTAGRRKKSYRCPKTRKTRSLRSALRCVRAKKGKSVASKRIYNKALRRLRKSKTYRHKVRGLKLAKHRGRAVA